MNKSRVHKKSDVARYMSTSSKKYRDLGKNSQGQDVVAAAKEILKYRYEHGAGGCRL